MNELRFDRILTGTLLAFSVWYAITMFLYPSNAGRIPGIVASVAIVALVVQLLLSFRPPSAPVEATQEITVVPIGGGDAGTQRTSLAAVPVIEKDSYDNLLALRGPRLRRLLVITGFIFAYLFGAMLVGFVLATTILLPAVLLLSGERLRVAVIAAVAGAVSSYLLVVHVLFLPLFDGFFFGGW
jgi:hypothetical protein